MFLNLFRLFTPNSHPLSSSSLNHFVTRTTLRLHIFVLLYAVTGSANATSQSTVLTVVNGSSVTMKCEPAEHLVRTHMAPDFESPQLIRKLDWFHEDALIASYQQVGRPHY
ncbi:unnamed protein product [Toxocara canis]|uniref:Ig-like domain-containing protein n=1 Tax=Toxocara canis TaxID=6265 RepID=A0A183TY31_TOXCA|nr:unnamed protein product [Toxocara canis]